MENCERELVKAISKVLATVEKRFELLDDEWHEYHLIFRSKRLEDGILIDDVKVWKDEVIR